MEENSQTFSITLLAMQHANNQKKRPLQLHQHQTTIRKRSKAAAEPYKSKLGHLVPGLLPPNAKVCWERCQLPGCLLEVPIKVDIFRNFRRLSSYDTQSSYLLGLVSRMPGEGIKSFKYYLNVNGVRKECCRASFMDIHKIGRKAVKVLQDRLERGEISVQDARGTHLNRPHRVTEEMKTMMRNHILAYPLERVHYSRRHEDDRYLPADLNVSKMFREFRMQFPDLDNVENKEWLYRDVFKSTGIRILAPKSDTCTTCDTFTARKKGALTQAEEDQINDMHHRHLLSADSGYKTLQRDIERSQVPNSNVVVKCIDLQQVLFSPQLSNSEAFYLREYSSYNFCVYDGRTGDGTMCFWHEVEGKRGVNEIGSVLLKVLRQEFQQLRDGEERSLILWSDRCRGQNNNWYIVCLGMLLMKEGLFTKFEQKFLVSGHSFLPCDRLFALIERRKKVKSAMIPQDWINIIKEAQPSRPFPVVRMKRHDFQCVKELERFFPRPREFRVSTVAAICVYADSPHELFSKSEHNGWWQTDIVRDPLNQDEVIRFNLNPIILPLCYPVPIEVSLEKKRNIKRLLKFLHPVHDLYYTELLNLNEI